MGETPKHTLSSESLGGLRLTKQRQVVYEVLVDEKRDHPTASEVFERAKDKMPSISLATVYNCLETLTQVGAIKQVNLDREASRYCPNLNPHAHFYCTECDGVVDIQLAPEHCAESPWALPAGTQLKEIDVTMKGVCPDCQANSKQN
ncbi:MAG: Fur family transcriptional regulator [Verrucomicrobiales bacterium]|nr:Fur family transcriptional regulator [Verrucomicrobiales bacterium]